MILASGYNVFRLKGLAATTLLIHTQSKTKIMRLPLYKEVVLNQDFTQYELKKGDVAMLNDYVPHPAGGEEGCILEVYNATGEFLKVVTVPISSIEAFSDRISRTYCQNGKG
jgi:hypothetical protein